MVPVLFIVAIVPIGKIRAQTDSCSLPVILSAFRGAVDRQNVREWALEYEGACSEEVSKSVLILGAGWVNVFTSITDDSAVVCASDAILNSFFAAALSDATVEWEQAYEVARCDGLSVDGISLMATSIRAYHGERVDAIIPQVIQFLRSDGSQLVAGDFAIAYGQTLEGVLEGPDGDTWTFYGTEGDYISITLTSEDFDTYLELYDPSNELLAEDDDSLGNLDSRINATLEETGTFTIIARSFGGESEGSYALSLEVAASNMIVFGETVRTQLFPAGNLFVFDSESGDFVTILMTSEDFDTYLELYEPGGDMVASDDDSAGDLDSLITFAVPSDGRYVILARALSDSGSGEFALLVTRATDNMIEYGQAIEADLTISSGTRYAFSANEGDNVRILLSSEDFDCYLELYNDQGDLLASNDDGGGNYDSLIEYQITRSGTYIILARGYGGTNVGNYTIELNR